MAKGQIASDEEVDEYAQSSGREPKVMATTCVKPSGRLRAFIGDFLRVIPSSTFQRRGTYSLKDMSTYAANLGFSDIILFSEHDREPDGMLFMHLPSGPTATFALRSARAARALRHRAFAEDPMAAPEVLCNRFTSRLGKRVERMLSGLLSKTPDMASRRVVTFHNQRDFIFFRHHMYGFSEDGKAVALHEIGLRCTLRLLSIQEGTFDTTRGECEFIARVCSGSAAYVYVDCYAFGNKDQHSL